MPTLQVIKRDWNVASVQPSAELSAYTPLVQRLLTARGITSASEAEVFLRPEPAELPDASLLPDIEIAIRRLRTSIAAGELIALYGDYDVDGLTATTILSEGLRDLGARVITHIPNRFSEGYGVNIPALHHLRETGAKLLVTIDCGISAIKELGAAEEMGLDSIVLDHHEPPDTLPPAVAIVDPKRAGASYPTRELCSGGLALRLLDALYAAAGRTLVRDRFLDLAALATVCDMVPLQGENREIVKAGLKAMAVTKRPGLRALLAISGAAGERPAADTLAFRIGPRLNAAGRLGDANEALELLGTKDQTVAQALAARLNEINQQRQQAVEAAYRLAEELVEHEPADAPVLVVGDASISRGIVGLVASRLVERYGRPAFVYERGTTACTGSARGAAGFDVVDALSSASDLLTRHGGHRAAGGFSLSPEHLAALRQRLWQAAEAQLLDQAPAVRLNIDAETRLSALDSATLRAIWAFAPCGNGNPEPLLLSRGVRVLSRQLAGNGKHLSLRLADGWVTWRAFAFNRAADAPPVGSAIDIVYAVEAGRAPYGPRLTIRDLAHTETKG